MGGWGDGGNGGGRKGKELIAPAEPEAQAVIQLVVDDCFYNEVISGGKFVITNLRELSNK